MLIRHTLNSGNALRTQLTVKVPNVKIQGPQLNGFTSIMLNYLLFKQNLTCCGDAQQLYRYFNELIKIDCFVQEIIGTLL